MKGEYYFMKLISVLYTHIQGSNIKCQKSLKAMDTSNITVVYTDISIFIKNQCLKHLSSKILHLLP